MQPKLLAALLYTGIALLMSSCLDPDFDHYPLHVQARGLSETETVIVSNGSTLEITGRSDLGWTEARKFKQAYRTDRKEYSVRILRQPANSNKACRVLNPKGTVGININIIRVECGYPLVIADSNMTMNTDNGLLVSNQFQQLALNPSRMLVTSLFHEIVQDPGSNDPNQLKLRISPQEQDGAVSFNELYLEGEPVSISYRSVNQGCEISGANNNSSLNFTFPSPEAFTNTVQTIPLENDWIASNEPLADGRTCNDFTQSDEYYLDLDLTEKVEGTGNTYTATCYPAPVINMTCGFALKVQVIGLEEGESIVVSADREEPALTPLASHSITFENNGTQTFNLAFENSNFYTVTIDDVSNVGGGKTCAFDNAPTGDFSGGSNITEIIRCEI